MMRLLKWTNGRSFHHAYDHACHACDDGGLPFLFYIFLGNVVGIRLFVITVTVSVTGRLGLMWM